jgi:hypothetical protein
LVECPAIAGGARRAAKIAGRYLEPEDIESHVTGAPWHAEQLVELWSAGLIDHDHLAVDYGFVDAEHGRRLLAERLETAQDIAVARDEAATALLDVAQRTKSIVFEVEEPAPFSGPG